MPSDKINTFSIYLIKNGFEIGDQEISDDGCINIDLVDNENALDVDGVRIGRLFTKKPELRYPRWARVFQDILPREHFGRGGVPSAVLVIGVDGREYAVTFGQGRYILNSDSIEEQFGLKAAINMLDVKALRSLDKRSFDTISKQSREQASREVDVKEFGIDIEQDLLRSVTGTPVDPNLGVRATGMDALKVSVRAELGELPTLLRGYQVAFNDKKYMEHFSWVDHLSEIRNT